MTNNISEDKPHKNGVFTSRFGFILACVGSAVGMGNIWMFPYRLGSSGGGAFLIIYIMFIILFGIVGLSAEIAVGRLVGTGVLGCYKYCWKNKKMERFGYIIGWIPLAGSLGIAIGYSIIVGWVLRFLGGSISGAVFTTDPNIYFQQNAGSFASVPWHFITIAIVCAILMFGSTKGIERVNKILMPAFFILFAFLAVRVAFLPGAADGYKFLFIPKWSELFKIDTWIMAMGQAFFSLSITGSAMIVYGTYLNKSENIVKSSIFTAAFDTVAAMLSALCIIPAVFAYGITPTAGPPLIFITLPVIFKQMPFGRVFAIMFFLSVSFAGITSLLNMFEAVVEPWQTEFKISRKKAVMLCGAICFFIGIFLESETAVSAWMDFITINIVPFGALLGAVTIYYVLGYKKISKELLQNVHNPLLGFVSQYIYVPLVAAVFILGLVYGGIG